MSALGDVIVEALKDLLRALFSPIEGVIETHGSEILDVVVGTPHPDTVFSPPTNDPWLALYDYYWGTWTQVMLFLWAGMIGLVIFFESTSHLFGSYHRSKLKRRAFAGLLGLLSWWWLAALSLRFVDALTGFIIPDLSSVSLFETLSFSGMGVLGLVVALSTDLTLFILIALLYVVRQVVLYLFVLLMPVLIVFWVPGVGPFALVSKFMRRLAGFYVPFLFMTVPVALLFRLGDILGTSFGLSLEGFGAWIIALIIPLIAVVSPFVLFWQAGALFFMADRAARYASRRRAQARAQAVRRSGQQARQGGRNFARGLRGKPAIRQDGQMVLDSGGSRAHAAGTRIRSTGSNLRSRSDSGPPGRGGGGSGGGSVGGSGGRGGGGPGEKSGGSSRGGSGHSRSPDGGTGRATDFENLQNRHRAADRSDRAATTDDTTDSPPYIP